MIKTSVEDCGFKELTEKAKESVRGAFEKPEFLCALADSLAARKN